MSYAQTPAGSANKQFFDAIKGGKGFIALHCGSDTFHSPGHKGGVGEDNSQVDPYIAMLGGEFVVHGAQQKAKMVCVDHKFPGFADVGDGFSFQEEWYALKNFATDLHVILVQDCAGMSGSMYQRPPFPATWARKEGKGRNDHRHAAIASLGLEYLSASGCIARGAPHLSPRPGPHPAALAVASLRLGLKAAARRRRRREGLHYT